MPENKRSFSQFYKRNGTQPGEGERGAGQAVTQKQVRTETNFAARFGTAIAEYGLAAVPAALYHYQGKLGLSAQEVWFVGYVLSHKWGEDLPRPSLKQLQKCSGLSDRTVQRYRERLEQSGFLKVETRYHASGRQSECAYDFSCLFEALEQAIQEDPRPLNPIHGGEEEGQREDEDELSASQSDRSFVARYGSVLAKRGVAVIPRVIFTCMGALKLTPQQVWFISYIFSFQWTAALPYPSILKMAARTGYSKVQLHDIKGSLVDRGYLRLVHRSTKDGGRDSNAYDFSGLFDAILAHMKNGEAEEGGKEEAVVPVATSDNLAAAQLRYARRGGRAAKQGRQAIQRNSVEGDREFTEVGGTGSLPGRGTKGLPTKGDKEFTGEGDDELTGSVAHPSPTRGTRSLPGRGTSNLYKEESIQEESQYRVDSNQRPRKNKNGLSHNERANHDAPFSPYISSIMADFSDELNDPDHIISNVTQTLRIWKMSGLGEQEFAELLFEARKTVRVYQGKQGLGTINNKMGYFFRVLRQFVDGVGAGEGSGHLFQQLIRPERAPGR